VGHELPPPPHPAPVAQSYSYSDSPPRRFSTAPSLPTSPYSAVPDCVPAAGRGQERGRDGGQQRGAAARGGGEPRGRAGAPGRRDRAGGRGVRAAQRSGAAEFGGRRERCCCCLAQQSDGTPSQLQPRTCPVLRSRRPALSLPSLLPRPSPCPLTPAPQVLKDALYVFVASNGQLKEALAANPAAFEMPGAAPAGGVKSAKGKGPAVAAAVDPETALAELDSQAEVRGAEAGGGVGGGAASGAGAAVEQQVRGRRCGACWQPPPQPAAPRARARPPLTPRCPPRPSAFEPVSTYASRIGTQQPYPITVHLTTSPAGRRVLA
jgi:hypothetical protein